MKIFIHWIVLTVLVSAVLFLLASFANLSFLWVLSVEPFTRFVYGIIQIGIIVGSFAVVIDVNEKAQNEHE